MMEVAVRLIGYAATHTVAQSTSILTSVFHVFGSLYYTETRTFHPDSPWAEGSLSLGLLFLAV